MHAEGAGQAQRAARLGGTSLAHAPFTERLSDAEIAEQAASLAWISTLAIHEPAASAIAVDNVRRFLAAGGVVRYGTDMGNGPTPVGLNDREIGLLRDAGLDNEGLLAALDAEVSDTSRLLYLPDASPGRIDPSGARPLHPDDLKD